MSRSTITTPAGHTNPWPWPPGAAIHPQPYRRAQLMSCRTAVAMTGSAAGDHQRRGQCGLAAGLHRSSLRRIALRHPRRRRPVAIRHRRRTGQDRSAKQPRPGKKQAGLPHPRKGLTTTQSVNDQPKQIRQPSTTLKRGTVQRPAAHRGRQAVNALGMPCRSPAHPLIP
jgi:hypothetical protein